ncbi:putative Kelch repeat-containing protein [Seiridium cardinale]|uniref:Kelch repeat-containing protein n=1 Tax=Seiridium cardinale TaxID=138064 RepID=A0ABR2XC92_9PEZI
MLPSSAIDSSSEVEYYPFDDGQALHQGSELFWLSLNETVDVSGPVDISNDVFPVLPTEGTEQSGAATCFFYNHTMLYSFARTETGDVSKELWAFNTVSDR